MAHNTDYPTVAWYTRLTASGSVGDSGKAVDVVGYTISSKAAAGVPYFINGTSVAGGVVGSVYFQDQGRVAASEQSVGLAYRTRFPAGCWVSFDANTSNMTVFYQQVLT